MVQHRSRLATELELCLGDGLPALRSAAEDLGAKSVSMFLIQNGRTIRNLYMWPETGEPNTERQLDEALDEALRDHAGSASERSPMARFLDENFRPGGTSFLLLSCGDHRLRATVAFGFRAPPAAKGRIARDVPVTARLAVVAAWSVHEVLRVQDELAIVNERLGKRKLIERAKGLLQAEHGLDEQQAYEHLRKLSRQRRTRMSEVAKDLLGASHFP